MFTIKSVLSRTNLGISEKTRFTFCRFTVSFHHRVNRRAFVLFQKEFRTNFKQNHTVVFCRAKRGIDKHVRSQIVVQCEVRLFVTVWKGKLVCECSDYFGVDKKSAMDEREADAAKRRDEALAAYVAALDACHSDPPAVEPAGRRRDKMSEQKDSRKVTFLLHSAHPIEAAAAANATNQNGRGEDLAGDAGEKTPAPPAPVVGGAPPATAANAAIAVVADAANHFPASGGPAVHALPHVSAAAIAADAVATHPAAYLLRALSPALRRADRLLIEDAMAEEKDEKDVVFRNGQEVCLRKNFRTLMQDTWLNDEVIHCYLHLLNLRDEQVCSLTTGKRSYFFKSFFMSKLRNDFHKSKAKHGIFCYKNVQTWSKKVPGKFCFVSGSNQTLF